MTIQELFLAKINLPQIIPRLTLCSQISLVQSCLTPENIQVWKIEKQKQLADIFTKDLVKSTFEYI